VASSLLSAAGLSTILSKQFHQTSILDPLLDQFIAAAPKETASDNLNKRLMEGGSDLI